MLKKEKPIPMLLDDIKNITTDIIKEIVYLNKDLSEEIFKDEYLTYKVREKIFNDVEKNIWK